MAIWAAGEYAVVMPDAQVQRFNSVFDDAASTITLSGARNEVVGFQLLVTNPRSKEFRLVATPFVSGQGNLGLDSVHLYRQQLEVVDAFDRNLVQYSGRSAVVHSVPNVLVPQPESSIRVHPNQTNGLWVDIEIDGDQPAGDYESQWTFISAFARRQVTVKLCVHDFAIPAQLPLHTLMLFDHDGLSAPDIDAYFQLAHSHRFDLRVRDVKVPIKRNRDGSMRLLWDAYDESLGSYIDGSGFADGRPVVAWPLPVWNDYPDPTVEGGRSAPVYQQKHREYIGSCMAHFKRRGWMERAILCLDDHEVLGGAAAPHRVQTIEAAGLDNVPPSGLWLRPGRLPFAPSFHTVDADASVAGIGAMAYAFDLSGIGPYLAAGAAAGDPLFEDGLTYGVKIPLATLRAKWLRRALQDHAYYRLLSESGRDDLARQVAGQLVTRLGTDAMRDHAGDGRPVSWATDPEQWQRGRDVVAEQITLAQIDEQDDANIGLKNINIKQFLDAAGRVDLSLVSVSISGEPGAYKLSLWVQVENRRSVPASGVMFASELPEDWRVAPTTVPTIVAGGHELVEVEMTGPRCPSGSTGRFVLPLVLEESGINVATTMLPVAWVQVGRAGGIELDGDFDEWPWHSTASIGKLITLSPGNPTVQQYDTQVWLLCDDSHLYLAIRCQDSGQSGRMIRRRNFVDYDGGVPWDEDLIELAFHPQAEASLEHADRIYHMLIKPNGMIIDSRGAPGVAVQSHGSAARSWRLLNRPTRYRRRFGFHFLLWALQARDSGGSMWAGMLPPTIAVDHGVAPVVMFHAQAAWGSSNLWA